MASGALDCVANRCIACCCAPCCCVASVFTGVTGGGTALVFGTLGLLGTGVAAITDIPEVCRSSKPLPPPQNQRMDESSADLAEVKVDAQRTVGSASNMNSGI